MKDEKIQWSYRSAFFRLGEGETVEHLYDELGFVYVVESRDNVPYAIKCHDAASLRQHSCPQGHALEVLTHLQWRMLGLELVANGKVWEVSWSK